MERNIEDELERGYWDFDARRKGYAEYKSHPQTERDAFKQVVRKLIKDFNEDHSRQ